MKIFLYLETYLYVRISIVFSKSLRRRVIGDTRRAGRGMRKRCEILGALSRSSSRITATKRSIVFKGRRRITYL